MESLSEAVSGLILLVISFQESGAPMPPHIPPAAVCSSSQNSLLFTFNLFLIIFFILLFSSFSHSTPPLDLRSRANILSGWSYYYK